MAANRHKFLHKLGYFTVCAAVFRSKVSLAVLCIHAQLFTYSTQNFTVWNNALRDCVGGVRRATLTSALVKLPVVHVVPSQRYEIIRFVWTKIIGATSRQSGQRIPQLLAFIFENRLCRIIQNEVYIHCIVIVTPMSLSANCLALHQSLPSSLYLRK